MKKSIVIYHAPIDAMKQMASATPEGQAKGMESWMQWALNCGDKLIDMGAPLLNGRRLNPDATSMASNREVTGYSVLQAENLDEAKALLTGYTHPGWNAGCSIEVFETMPLHGM